MKVLIAGAGGIGGFLGGFLVRSGISVDFLVRREEARTAILSDGIEIQTKGESFTVHPQSVFTELPRDYAADLLIMAVKGSATGDVLKKLAAAKFEAAASLQNGLDKYEILQKALGREKVVGMFTLSFATAADDGTIRLEKLGTTYIGALDGAQKGRAEEIAGLFVAAGLPTVLTDDILSCEWSKKAHWIPVSVVSAVAGCYFSQVFSSAGLRALYLSAMREVKDVAEASGIGIRDLEEFEPLKLTGMREEDALAYLEEKGKTLENGPLSRYKQIMLQDLESGKKTEMEETGGFVARKAEELSIPIPHLDTLVEIIRFREGAMR